MLKTVVGIGSIIIVLGLGGILAPDLGGEFVLLQQAKAEKGEPLKLPASCGNNILENDEECDPTVPNSCYQYETCSFFCKCQTTCGDGKKSFHEECDASAPGGGCPAGQACFGCRCTPLCGNTSIDAGEECDPSCMDIDDPTTDCFPNYGCPVGDLCENDCTCTEPDIIPIGANCGNGQKDPGEQCDPSALPPDNACASDYFCDEVICQCLPPVQSSSVNALQGSLLQEGEGEPIPGVAPSQTTFWGKILASFMWLFGF